MSTLTEQPPSTDRQTPVSMIVIGAVLLAGFLAVSGVMVLTVTNGRATPAPPDGSEVVLPAAVETIDSHAICRAEACDGTGLVVHWDPIIAHVAVDMLATHLAGQGWVDHGGCPAGSRCMAMDDLRLTVKPWMQVDPSIGAVMRSSIRDRGLDDSDFLYVKVTRCGILEGC